MTHGLNEPKQRDEFKARAVELQARYHRIAMLMKWLQQLYIEKIVVTL